MFIAISDREVLHILDGMIDSWTISSTQRIWKWDNWQHYINTKSRIHRMH